MFGRKKLPLITCTFKVDTSSSLWQATVRKVLNKAGGVRSFMLDDYGVEVFGRVDPQRLLGKLAKAGICGTLLWGTSGSTRGYVYHEYDHLYDSYGTGGMCNYNHGYGSYGGAGWSVCGGGGGGGGGCRDYDWCYGNGGYSPGPFAKLAREFLHNNRRRHSSTTSCPSANLSLRPALRWVFQFDV